MFDDGDFEDELATKQLSRFNVLELKIAFEWTLKHFAELDLGGNLKWYKVATTILKNLTKSSWNDKKENELVKNFLFDTRWYDF